MTVKTKELCLQTKGKKITFFRITDEVKRFIEETQIINGIITVQTEHTTCAVFFEEMVHDCDIKGDEFLQVDLNKGLEKIFPAQTSDDGYYRYPGPLHLEQAKTKSVFWEDPSIMLNGPAHLKATLLGASQTFVIQNGEMQIGRCGDLYFVDFDYSRPRQRKVHICAIGEQSEKDKKVREKEN